MTKAIRLHQRGGPEVLKWEDVEMGTPADQGVLMRHTAMLGAKVIGVVSSQDKARLAKRNGCHRVLVGYDDMAVRVRKLNRGRGVDVVYDGVGKDTLMASLDSLRPRGMLLSFGNASGAAEPFAPAELVRRGSLFFTRTAAPDLLGTPEARREAARSLFGLIRRKAVRIHIGQRYALADAAQAQRDLESRQTLGSRVLVP